MEVPVLETDMEDSKKEEEESTSLRVCIEELNARQFQYVTYLFLRHI